MKKAAVLYFWFYKLKKKGFAPATVHLLAHTIEYKSEWLNENRPVKLRSYLRHEGRKRPQAFVTEPFTVIREEHESLVKVLGRELPKLE